MKKNFSFGALVISLMSLLVACGGNAPAQQSSSRKTTSRPPAKTVKDLSISLLDSGGKAYIQVKGTQANYTAEEFKWAWGLKEQDGSSFADGKANPAAEDFQPATFDDNNQFTVRYCLTDITTIRAGQLYRIYGGTPETYDDIPFASNMFGAKDGTRKYYLRQDKDNSLVFDSIQPITWSMASIVELPENNALELAAGPYLKIGGVNAKSYTLDKVLELEQNSNIAGDFQLCVGGTYSQHIIPREERGYEIDSTNFYVYLYCGFIQEGEGWMVHFDLVSGNVNAGLHTSTVFEGETAYTINGATYRIYSDQNKGGEENYWGCLGVYRDAAE